MLAEFVKHFWNNLLTVSLQSKQMQRRTPLNQAAAMLKLSGQSDPDLQRYLRNTHTYRQTEIPCFYREMFVWCLYTYNVVSSLFPVMWCRSCVFLVEHYISFLLLVMAFMLKMIIQILFICEDFRAKQNKTSIINFCLSTELIFCNNPKSNWRISRAIRR